MGWLLGRCLIPIVVVGALWLPSDDAMANSCFVGVDVLLPSGAAPVPANTRIWVGDAYATGELRLVDAGGEEVPTRTSTLARVDAGDSVRVLTPDAPLVEGEYRVLTGDAAALTFTVDGEVDVTPPKLPTGITDEEPAPECSLIRADAAGRTDELIVARVDAAGALDPEGPSGSVTDMNGLGVFVIGGCGCVSTWRDAAPGERFEIEFAAFDLAGNFSGWSAPVESMLAEDESGQGCGCRSEPASDSWLPLLFVFALAAAPRTRR